MPTTVSKLFAHFDLEIKGPIKWGQEVSSDKSGIYVVALTGEIAKLITTQEPNFDTYEIYMWIKKIKKGGKLLKVNDEPATVKSIKNRLKQFWLPDETILYIGKAGPIKGRTLKKRLIEFYNTELGCNKPHAGGHWLHTLKNLPELNIFYAETNPDIEADMILYFRNNVSSETKSLLYDSFNCYPFANKEVVIRKKHGFSNQTIDCGKR